MCRTITSILRDFKILFLLLVFNDLKCIKLSAFFLKSLPASKIFGVGIHIFSLFLFTCDFKTDQSPHLKQCVQINQPKKCKYYII